MIGPFRAALATLFVAGLLFPFFPALAAWVGYLVFLGFALHDLLKMLRGLRR